MARGVNYAGKNVEFDKKTIEQMIGFVKSNQALQAVNRQAERQYKQSYTDRPFG
jgi:hypothetical protein